MIACAEMNAFVRKNCFPFAKLAELIIRNIIVKAPLVVITSSNWTSVEWMYWIRCKGVRMWRWLGLIHLGVERAVLVSLLDKLAG